MPCFCWLRACAQLERRHPLEWQPPPELPLSLHGRPWFAGVSAPCVPRTVLKNVPLGCIHPATTFLPTSNLCLFTKLQDVAKCSWVLLAMPREAPGAMLGVRHPNITGH